MSKRLKKFMTEEELRNRKAEGLGERVPLIDADNKKKTSRV